MSAMGTTVLLAVLVGVLVAPAMGSGGIVFKDDSSSRAHSSPPLQQRPADAANVTFGGESHPRGPRLTPADLDSSPLQDASGDHHQDAVSGRNGKSLLNLIGLGTGPETDPYLSRLNQQCLLGDFAECFKSRALSSMEDFFDKEQYQVNDNARVIRIHQGRSLENEPYEFVEESRVEEPEWDQFTKFLQRRVERFLKSTAIEVKLPAEVTGDGQYAPRFIDDIATEVDYLEDKTDTKFSRFRLKKLLVPMLIILKLFKIKLLAFLPIILGLASFKKVLGFATFIIPGIIAFFRFCGKNDVGFAHSNFYKPPPHPHYPPTPPHASYPHYGPYNQYGNGASLFQGGFKSNQPVHNAGSPSVSFRDPEESSAHEQAYSGYENYRK